MRSTRIVPLADKVKGILNEDRPGFSGVNHMLSTIMVMLILLLVPVEPFSSFLSSILAYPAIGVLAFFTVIGGSLLPDADNAKADGGSLAVWQLGFIGSILSSIMVTISSIMTTVFKTSKDNLPPTQHRMFWHTWVVPLLMFILIFLFIPSTPTKISESPNMLGNIALLVCLEVVLFVGSACLVKKIPIVSNRLSQIFAFTLCIGSYIYLWTTCDMQTLKMLMFCVALGYGCHLLGDMFADTGVPMFPVCFVWSGAFWKRFCFLGKASVKTGSTTESLLKFVFLFADIALVLVVFFGIGVFSDIGAFFDSIKR